MIWYAVRKMIAAVAIYLAIPSAAPAFSLDLPGAFFKPGHPVGDETLHDALDPARVDESLNNMRATAERLAMYDGIYYAIAGHADSGECDGSECGDLSLRRARVVFRHLLSLGVDPMRLDALDGWGTERPLREPQSEETWLNRRVEINVSN